MNKDKIILFFILYLIGCVIIYVWQHRDDIKGFMSDFNSEEDKNVSGRISNEISFDEQFVTTSKNFLLVNQLFFTNNYFDFDKFLDFVSRVDEDNISFSDALQSLTLLNLLVKVSSSLTSDFNHQLFFSNRDVLDIKDVKRKIADEEYTSTVADFYEILISLIFHYKKFLIYK